MGSLSSPPPSPTPPPPPPPPVGVPAPAPIESGAEESGQSSAEARTESLLRRNRGRFGTVQTSFRGLLGLAGNNGRKTLLGE